MGRHFRVVKPCYIFTFEGQDRPQHYRINNELEYDLEFKRDDEGDEIIPDCLVEIGTARSRAKEPAGPPPGVAISESSRRLTVQRAVAKLDNEERDSWTGEGRPAVHAVNTAASDPNPTITRQEITLYCPTVLRS